jgi:ankyrin repeat protein
MAVSDKKTSRYISAFDAVTRGDLKELMRIVPVMVNLKYNEKCPVEDSPFYRCSLLHAAAVHGSPEIVTYLISRGLKTSLKNGMGQTPMHCAISMRKKNICEILQILLAAPGAGVNARDFDGDSLLHYAVCRDIKIVEFLVKNKAKTDVKNFWGETPLHTAAEKSDVPAIKYLLSHRAVIDERDSFGGTALKSAICGKDPEKAVAVLLSAGADPDSRDNDGNTPLHIAAMSGETGVVKLLIKAGADRSVTNNEGVTASHLCDGELSLLLVPPKRKPKKKMPKDLSVPSGTKAKSKTMENHTGRHTEQHNTKEERSNKKKRTLPAAKSFSER